MAEYPSEESTTTPAADTAFRRAFKFYRHVLPDEAPDLIDFDQPNRFPSIRPRNVFEMDTTRREEWEASYLRWPTSEWRAFEVDGKPGLVFLQNPFDTPRGHLYWAGRCLVDYSRWPNATNVDQMLERQGISVEGLNKFDEERALKKLRWATMGYQHDWDTKVYSESNRSRVPDDLGALSRSVAAALFGPASEDFRAEAVIVNFYRPNSTLAGHVDRSERNMELPLFSFSLGHSAVFLVGGPSADDPPVAVRIRSGDVVVMSGQCRSAYHGVPRVFAERDARPYRWSGDGDPRVADYLNGNRINMNVRQVD